MKATKKTIKKAIKKAIPWMIAAALLGILLLLGGCAVEEAGPASQPEAHGTVQPVLKAAVPDANDMPLVDKASVYADDDPDSLVTFYVTVRRGKEADGTNHSLADVNAVVALQEMIGVEKVKAEVIFQEGDENGPYPGSFGYDATQTNGTIRIRGKSSTLAAQKSYRIDLFDNAGLWRGQRAIALVKHMGDPSRIRNKLYFDLLKDVPDVLSLRTQFVHLYIKDETADPPAIAFEDYGLFTFVETPNRRYLRNHELSLEGNLYKANIFEFFRYPEKLRLATDPLYDPDLFSNVIDFKNGEDHSKLLAMLDDLNNYSIPIETIVEKYFNLDNMMSFLAFNILMGNADYNSQNFFLYSPVNSDTWYFLLWDGDGSLHYASDEIMGRESSTAWQRGITNVWNMVLFNRALRVEAYRERLIERVEMLREIITPERIAKMIETYRTVVDDFTHSMPDQVNLPATFEQMEAIYAQMPYDTDKAYEYFLESLKKPMPFFQGEVVKEDGRLKMTWSEAYDFGGQLVRYTVEVADDWSFAEDVILYRNENLLQLSDSLDMLPPGEYWWRVVAYNADGESQISFDKQTTATGLHQGMRAFSIDEKGTVDNGT